MNRFYCRAFQNVMKITSPFLPWREPELIAKENALFELPKWLKANNLTRVLLVTDEGIVKAGLMESFLQKLLEMDIQYFVYDGVVPNPTIDNIEEALQLYKQNHCTAIIAFGGGSPMDCAKGVGARVARPQKTIPQMKGLLRVRKSLPPLVAIPTTAGTGSEATLAAVVSNRETHEKYALMDPSLIPTVAVLDPLLTINLPAHITSTTGMDALTHAVEAYIGKSNTKQTEAYSREATQIIFQSLYEAYSNPTNIEARSRMQRAAYVAGYAFTRAYVGYVHAIAHTLGGFYNVPHGLANAVILPIVLEYYGDSVHERLAELADVAGLATEAESKAQKAKKFIQAIRDLNERMNIPTHISAIQDVDVPLMVKRALAEANPLYPVPKIFGEKDMFHLFKMVKG